MRLLLDTHVLLWWLGGSRQLGPKTRDIISDASSLVWVSAASAWEIAIKAALGRLLIAQARLEELTLVTADATVGKYDVAVIDAGC